MSINRVMITGNLTRTPELRATQGGTSVLTFGVAVNDRRKNPKTGDWEDYPNYVDCALFGKRAETVAKFIDKGSKVAIEGSLRYSSWDKDGQKRSKLEVIVDEIEFLSQSKAHNGPRQQQADNYSGQGQSVPNSGRQAPAGGYSSQGIYEDSDIPF